MNQQRPSAAHLSAELESAQARFAARVAAGLKSQAAVLPHDISERLRVAREHALRSARQLRAQQAPSLAAAPSVVATSSSGAAVLGSPSPWWLKLASGLPLAVLLLGLVVIGQWNNHQQVRAAAEVDAQLLSDELPPRAYADPGFAEYLKASQP
jgi:nucleotide-binding universal stress UspA family protein